MTERYERVSDDERQDALKALGEHFSKGRLDMAEYEERTERAAASVTYQDLDDLFTDLPLPHYETGLAVREEPQAPAPLSEEQLKQRKKRLSKIEEAGWAFAGLWVPFWYVVGWQLLGENISVGWFGAFIPMMLMGAYSIIFDIFYNDDEDDDDESMTRHERKRARREERRNHRHELPPADDA